MLKSEIKRNAALYGIFLGIIVGVFAVLIAMVFLSKNSWKNGLSVEVQSVLNDYEKDTYTVNKFIELNSPLSTSAAVYSLIKKGSPANEIYYGVIVRIPSVTGPAPAVFISGEKDLSGKYKFQFAGFAEDFGKAKDLSDVKLLSSDISYWETVVSKSLEKSLAK